MIVKERRRIGKSRLIREFAKNKKINLLTLTKLCYGYPLKGSGPLLSKLKYRSSDFSFFKKEFLRAVKKMNQDIRWQQRLSNYHKALQQLQRAVELSQKRELSELENQGLVQCFEYTHELAWKTLKNFLENQAIVSIIGSRDVVREAFKLGILTEGETWMQMIKSRNETSHIYDEAAIKEITRKIINDYFPQFQYLAIELDNLKEKEEKKL